MISTLAFANTIQLFPEPAARRLFKARHHEVDKMHIQTESLTALADSTNGLMELRQPRSCTVYKFKIRSATAPPVSPANGSQHDEWVLTHRYREFAAFRDLVLQLVRQWEAQIEACPDKIHSREFELVSNALRRPLAPTFPRKHLRSDNEVIVRERRRGLCSFVRMLIDVYADISVYLFNNHHARVDVGTVKFLHVIYEKLESFLQVPEAQKELERRHTAAILALEDIQVTNEPQANVDGHPERSCCICLDDYQCDDIPSQLFCDLETRQLEALARDQLVKLPCGHNFHEDCVIEWFNTSITCPLCRTPVVPDEDPRELEVVSP